MSIDHARGKKAIAPGAQPPWGEILPDGQAALVLRVCAGDRVVTYPVSELRRWEHSVGAPERLMISAGQEKIWIEGRELAAVRAVLDLGRLAEIRVTPRTTQPGPSIHTITLEPL